MIIKNIEPLSQNYIPKILLHRENEQQVIANCIKPLMQKKHGRNLIVYGKPGLGKTLAAKYILKEFEEKTDLSQLYPIYINCWKNNTPYKLILELTSQVSKSLSSSQKTDIILKEAIKELNKSSAVMILDEIDKLEDLQPVYQLIEDIYHISIIMITNKKEWFAFIDERLRSRLTPQTIEFKPYTQKQIYDILKQRIEASFNAPFNPAFNPALNLIAEKISELQDIRIGLLLLKETAEIAESENKRIIEKEHAEKAIANISNIQHSIFYKNLQLSDEMQVISSILKESKSKQEAYQKYKQTYNKSYRTFQRKLKRIMD